MGVSASLQVLMISGKYKIIGQFLQVETDEGLTGLSGPMFYPSTAFYIDTALQKHLIGEDPLKT